MDDLWKTITFGIGRNNDERVDHELFDDPTRKMPTVAPLKRMAANQLGTVGSGSHYVDIFSDELDRIWIGVHFGSRGLGHKTANHFLKAAPARMGQRPCHRGRRYAGIPRTAGLCRRLNGRHLGNH